MPVVGSRQACSLPAAVLLKTRPWVFSPKASAGQLAVDHAVLPQALGELRRCRACPTSVYGVRSSVTLRAAYSVEVVVVDLEDVRRVAAGGERGELVEVALVGLPGLLERDVRVLLGVERERLVGQLGAGLAAPPEDGELDRSWSEPPPSAPPQAAVAAAAAQRRQRRAVGGDGPSGEVGCVRRPASACGIMADGSLLGVGDDLRWTVASPGSAGLCGPGPGPVESRMTSSVWSVYLCGGAAVVAVLQQHVDGRPAGGRGGCGHRGQLGAGEPAQRDVVDADDADVLRAPARPAVVQPLDAGRSPSGRCRRARRWRRLPRTSSAAATPPTSVGGLGPRTVSSAPPARAAAVADRRISRLVHEPRGPPSRARSRWPRPTRCSIASRAPCADVHHHRGQAGRPGRLTTTSGTSRRSCSISVLLIRGLHSSTPSTCLASARTSSSSTSRVLVGVGDEDVVVALAGLALGRLDQRREERVGDVGDDQADVVGPAGDQRAGGPVGPVAQLLRGGQHPAAGLRVDQVRRREGAGHGGDVHAGGPGDVADGDWHGDPPVDDVVGGHAGWRH